MDFNISSPGKLLITAEYYVVKGALALAIPTKFRQSLDFKYNASNTLKWKSFDKKNDVWLNCEFQLSDFKIIKNKNIHSKTLQSILISASKLNPDFLNESAGGTVSTHLDFCRKWLPADLIRTSAHLFESDLAVVLVCFWCLQGPLAAPASAP